MDNATVATIIRQKERQRLNLFLAEEARKHEEELNAGNPLNLKLVKVRRGSY